MQINIHDIILEVFQGKKLVLATWNPYNKSKNRSFYKQKNVWLKCQHSKPWNEYEPIQILRIVYYYVIR